MTEMALMMQELSMMDPGMLASMMEQPDPETAREAAKQQLAFYFSPDNLARDTFLRQYMDVDGFIPVALLAQFQRMQMITLDVDIVREAIKELEQLEYDTENDKVRVRENWKMWLMPNAEGGFGLPRWSIAAAPEAAEEEAAGEEEEGAKGSDAEKVAEEEEAAADSATTGEAGDA